MITSVKLKFVKISIKKFTMNTYDFTIQYEVKFFF